MVEEKDSRTKSEVFHSMLQQEQLEEYFMTDMNSKEENKQEQSVDEERKKKKMFPDEHFQSMKQMQQLADYNAT